MAVLKWAEAIEARFCHYEPTSPVGANDNLPTVAANSSTLSKTALAAFLMLEGPRTETGALDAPCGCGVGGCTELLPGAVLTTSALSVAGEGGSDGALVVETRTRVVIAGEKPKGFLAGWWGVAIGGGTGATGTVLVRGPDALLNGGKHSLCVGDYGDGLLEIRDGGLASAGSKHPCGIGATLGEHPGSTGAVDVARGALVVNGAILVGCGGRGALDVGIGGVVSALDMTVGVREGGVGSVAVRGESATLAIARTLNVGQDGAGWLSVGNHGLLTAGQRIVVNGSVSLDDGRILTEGFTINPAGAVIGNGTIVAASGVANDGMMTATGRLALIGAVRNDGAISVARGGDLDIGGRLGGKGMVALNGGGTASLRETGTEQTVAFAETGAMLVLQEPGGFHGLILGFGPGDAIELAGPASQLAYDAGVLTVFDVASGPLARLRLAGRYKGRNFRLGAMSGARSVVRFQA